MSQRLTLSTYNRGAVFNRRRNPYSILLTYSHQRYSSNIQDRSYSPSASDLSWDADVSIIQPRVGGLTLYAMARDKERSIAETNAYGNTNGVPFPTQIRTQIYSEHGISITKGNRRTLKTFLSYFASTRGYKDFNEEIKFSHLSLQRGINWLHLDLEEKRISSINSEIRSIRIGNIAHSPTTNQVPSSIRLGEREWLRITNWFEISTDMEYRTRKKGLASKSTSYRLSFFGKGYRKIWSMFLYPRHSATKGTDKTSRSLELPLVVDYFPDRKFELNSNTRYKKDDTRDGAGTYLSVIESISEQLKAIIRPRSWLIVRPEYFIKKASSNGLGSLSQRLKLDLAARGAKYSASLGSGYSTSKSETLSGNDSKSDSFNISVRGRYRGRGWLRSFGLSQGYIIASTSSGNKTEKHISQLDLDAVFSYRLKADFRVSRTQEDLNGQTSKNLDVLTTLTYDTKKRFSNEMEVSMNKSESGEGSTKRTEIDDEAIYKFTKNLKSKTGINLSKESNDFGDRGHFRFEQRLAYSRLGGGFLRRKLYDINGGYILNKYDISGGQTKESSEYSLAIDYYLSRVVRFGGSYSYISDNAQQTRTLTKLFVSVNYPKLTAGISYDSAVTDSPGAGESVVEKINILLTKSF
ncbi:MAG: hypothetical protein IMF07_01790 [Proteobacteria bacterium]|nr:hypothetical protein [Pseudomonadota bacterium]